MKAKLGDLRKLDGEFAPVLVGVFLAAHGAGVDLGDGFGHGARARHGTVDDPRIVLIGIDVHAAVFLEVNKPKPVVLFELAKGWLTGERVEPGETHELRQPHR